MSSLNLEEYLDIKNDLDVLEHTIYERKEFIENIRNGYVLSAYTSSQKAATIYSEEEYIKNTLEPRRNALLKDLNDCYNNLTTDEKLLIEVGLV